MPNWGCSSITAEVRVDLGRVAERARCSRRPPWVAVAAVEGAIAQRGQGHPEPWRVTAASWRAEAAAELARESGGWPIATPGIDILREEVNAFLAADVD